MTKPRFLVIASAIGAVVAVGILVVTALTPLHQALFAVIPADGPVLSDERSAIDRNTVQFLISGKASDLASYSSVEQSHLADVRSRMITLALVAGILSIFLGFNGPTAREWRSARNWAFGLFVAVTIAFEPLFILMHELIFPGGNWDLPSSQYVITQVYPLGFFVACWILIGLFSVGMLASMARLNNHVQ